MTSRARWDALKRYSPNRSLYLFIIACTHDISCDIIHISSSAYVCMMASNPLLINKDILTISADSECLCPFCHSKFITPNMICWFSQKTSQLSPWSWTWWKFVFDEANTSGWNRNTGTLCFLPTPVNTFKFFLEKKITLLVKNYYLQGLMLVETKWRYKIRSEKEVTE